MKKENYNDIPMSEESKKGMSLTPDDQLFLKRCFDRQDDVTEKYISDTYDTHAKLIIDTVREIITEQNEIIKEIQGLILDIQEELRDHETRIKRLETKVRRLLIEHGHNHKNGNIKK